MIEIHESVRIRASADRVWGMLTDFGHYPEWNPFIRSISGPLGIGSRLRVTIAPGERRPMSFSPTVLNAEPGKELRWRGRLVLPHLFDGEHSFRITPTADGGVQFDQTERFTGILVPLLSRKFYEDVRSSFRALNEALRTRSESTAPSG